MATDNNLPNYNPECDYHNVPDFDPINSTDCYLLQPDNAYSDVTGVNVDGDDGEEVVLSPPAYFTVELVLITLIFSLALLANGSLTVVVNLNGGKTLRQKLLISVLTTTCIIRASVNFIRSVYH